jgi:hypothetical protein
MAEKNRKMLKNKFKLILISSLIFIFLIQFSFGCRSEYCTMNRNIECIDISTIYSDTNTLTFNLINKLDKNILINDIEILIRDDEDLKCDTFINNNKVTKENYDYLWKKNSEINLISNCNGVISNYKKYDELFYSIKIVDEKDNEYEGHISSQLNYSEYKKNELIKKIFSIVVFLIISISIIIYYLYNKKGLIFNIIMVIIMIIIFLIGVRLFFSNIGLRKC